MARPKGHIRKRGERYEIAVSLGRDPITKRYRYAYAYAKTEDEAQRERDRLLDRVAEGREPDSSATVNVLRDRWLAVADLELTTRESHEGYIRHPAGPRRLAAPQAPAPGRRHRPAVYTHLRRCSKLCDGRRYVEKHATDRPHDCAAERCRRHVCRPMQPRTIRQIHAILRTALGYAIKWGWIDRNPAQHASPPKVTASEIHPPDPKQAARLVETASDLDRELGMFVWLAMSPGRGAGSCAPCGGPMSVSTSVICSSPALTSPDAAPCRQGHQDPSAAASRPRRRHSRAPYRAPERCAKRAEDAGVDFLDGGYVFSRDGFGEEPWLPDTVTHQFQRAARKAGVSCRLHDLRHYTATQLIASGVDLRTVAGRLGHSGGGSITLKVYATGLSPPTRTPLSCWPRSSTSGPAARTCGDARSAY